LTRRSQNPLGTPTKGLEPCLGGDHLSSSLTVSRVVTSAMAGSREGDMSIRRSIRFGCDVGNQRGCEKSAHFISTPSGRAPDQHMYRNCTRTHGRSLNISRNHTASFQLRAISANRRRPPLWEFARIRRRTPESATEIQIVEPIIEASIHTLKIKGA
jgi:hypothetical protein